MARSASGHIEQLPSGSFRVTVYAGLDPLTGRRLRHRGTAKTKHHAQILLDRLLEQADAGRRPDSRVLVSELLEQYLEVAELEPSTRDSYRGYIRRTILPALGSTEVRKVRGPMLDTFYARLRRCGDPLCVSGRVVIEHNLFPDVSKAGGGGRFQRWQRIAGVIREAIRNGEILPGAELPSVQEMATRYELPVAAVRHAMESLVAEHLVQPRTGRPAIAAGSPAGAGPGPARVRGLPKTTSGHDCARAGCRPHACKPMSPATIRQIHAILSGAFAAAVRWEWIERNPASAAKLPKARPRSPASPAPVAVAKVIAAARNLELDLLALYLWLAAVTGARRGELCALRWSDIDLDRGIVHVASSYLVRSGHKLVKDTKTHQDRYLAIDPVTVAVLTERQQQLRDLLAGVGVALGPGAYVFTSDHAGGSPWNPDWVTHKVAEVAASAGVSLNVKALRHYTASQLLAGGIDLRNTAARLGHGGGGATTLRHYADPVSEVDRRAAAYLSQLTAASESGQ